MDEPLRHGRKGRYFFLFPLAVLPTVVGAAFPDFPIAPERFDGPVAPVVAFPLFQKSDRLVAFHLAASLRRADVLVLFGHGSADGTEVFGQIDARPLARYLVGQRYWAGVRSLLVLACSSGLDAPSVGPFAQRLLVALAALQHDLPDGVVGVMGKGEPAAVDWTADLKPIFGVKVMTYGTPPRTLSDEDHYRRFRTGKAPEKVAATELLPPLGIRPLLSRPSDDLLRHCPEAIATGETFIFPPSSGNDEAS